MKSEERKQHWDRVYQTGSAEKSSWYEAVPETSLSLVQEYLAGPDQRIIDVGGGDSLLVDHLLKSGYTDITVLDVSKAALDRARLRLGNKGLSVRWIAEDVLDFRPEGKYQLWHDRAAFHFFLDPEEVQGYVEKLRLSLQPEGVVILGTFAKDGPEKCSGLQVHCYSEAEIEEVLGEDFSLMRSFKHAHQTPTGSLQNYLYSIYKFRPLQPD